MSSKLKITKEGLKDIAVTVDSYRIRVLIDAKQEILNTGVYNEEQYHTILFKMFDEELVKYLRILRQGGGELNAAFDLLGYFLHHDPHREVVGLIGDRAPDFYVNTGDIVEDGDDADMWQVFFDIEHTLMSRMVMWPVMGNHDHRTDTLYDDFFHVNSDSGTSRYYSFDYSNCHFVVICSMVQPPSPVDSP